jgi:hypothetical protein
MVQRREGSCFALESRQAFRIGADGRGEDLAGDVAAEFCISRAIHVPHSA